MTAARQGQRGTWRAALPPDLAQQAAAVALELAERLSVSEPTGGSNRLSLADGAVGTALMCGYVGACTRDATWSVAAHGFLQQGVAAVQDGAVTPGLYAGLAGLGFAASELSTDGSRYQRLAASVDRALDGHLADRRGHGSADPVNDFDVVSGLTGLGAFLLTRADEPAGHLASTRLTDLLLGDPVAVPPLQWRTPAAAVVGPMRDSFPDGCLNFGLAHGLPGPLGLLALAWSAGVRVPRMAAAIEATADFLIAHCVDDRWGPDWPTGVAMDGDTDGTPARAAWCYGSPGVSRALWLAGRALDRTDWCGVALAAIRAVYRRPDPVWLTPWPGLCHGAAGLLAIALRFHHDTGDEFVAPAVRLTQHLLEMYDPQRRYGFADPDGAGDDDGNPGLLNGAAGVVCALLAAASDVQPTWDRMLLIA